MSAVEGAAGLRREVREAFARGEAPAAQALLRQFWATEAGPAAAAFVLAQADRLRQHTTLRSFKLAILRSCTIEPVVPLLRAGALVLGIDVSVHAGAFNAYTQDLLAPTSGLYDFNPDAVFLVLDSRDVALDLWQDFPTLSPEAVEAAIQRVVNTFDASAKALRARTATPLVIHKLEVPDALRAGVRDAQSQRGQLQAFARINQELLELAGRYPGAFLLDYDSLVARHGKQHWHDEQKWSTVRLPVSAAHLKHLAEEWLRFVVPLSGRVSKALVVDLDNTLWGGTLGEDGLTGIHLSPDHKGASFQNLQRVIRDLFHRGIILAVCSKNNASEAMEAIQSHPGMVLRPEHFAAVRINWQDKAQNLREIAQELNIGLDSLAFLDDNPAERQQVRMSLPDVNVIELPDDPASFADVIARSAIFERLVLSAEDRERGRYYAEQRMRSQLAESAPSLDAYYRSLQMTAEIATVTRETLPRAAQLTQKTNQFNLTTRRYTEHQVEEFAASRDSRVYLLRVMDRFGDNGWVGLAIVQFEGTTCTIDSFLLSCRVIGRMVETALLATIVEDAREQRMTRIVGSFKPTKKNSPAQSFYAAQGFRCTSEQPEETVWELDLTSADITTPEFIERRVLRGVDQ